MPKPEPQVRKDGRCANCGKPRRSPTAHNYDHAHWLVEPFCSRPCLEAYFGIATRASASGTTIRPSKGGRRMMRR